MACPFVRGGPGTAALGVLALLLGGCASPPEDGPPAVEDPNVHVYTSNQSFDDPTADLLVSIDGEAVFDGEAKVEGQHNWMLREAKLVPGIHRIEALERDNGARASKTFFLPAGEERWIVVDYWNPMREGSGEDGEDAGFTIHVSEEPVAFA